MAIKQSIELIGDDIVIRKFQNVQKEGEKAINSLAKTTLPELRLNVDPKPLQEFTGHATKLTDILKVLKPALTEAGASVGGLGAFARVAGVGMAGLAAAVGGAVVVKLADLEETAATTKARLSDLFGSTANGEKAFNALEASARSLHTTANELIPSIESLQRGIDKFNQTRGFKFVGEQPAGFAPDIAAQTAALANFTKELRASGLSTEQANAAAKEFFATLRAAGTVTADALNKLPTGTVVALADAFGKGKLTAEQFIAAITKGDISVNIIKATGDLAKYAEQADKAFNANAVKSYHDALTDLQKDVGKQLEVSTGKTFTDILIQGINEVSKGLQTSIEEAKRIIELASKIPIPPGIPAAGPAGAPTPDQTALVEQFRQTGVQSAEAFKRGFEGELPQTQSLFQSLYERIVSIFATPIPVTWVGNPFLSGQPTNLAAGGMVRGPGSTTSDSIMAFLSNSEFVVNARAVSHYGPALFAALNAMRLPKDFIGRFAMGGLARSVSGNRFAGGGQVRSGNPVILKIDRQTFNMTAGDDTVASLKRFAVAAQLASTGRKPSWVK